MSTIESGPELDLGTVRRVLELVHAHGIDFSYGGHVKVDPDDVILRLTDPEAFEASLYGVSVEMLRAWRQYDWRCRAHTRAGKRCRNYVRVVEKGRCWNADDPGWGEFAYFRPGEPDCLFCSFHLARLAAAKPS